MASEQKRAWTTLGIFAYWISACLALIISRGTSFTDVAWQALAWSDGLVIRAFVVVFAIGLISLIITESPLLFRRKREQAEVTEDERDRLIVRKAKLVAAFSSYTAFLLTWLIPWGIYGSRGEDRVPIDFLPAIGFSGAIVFFLTQAITIIVLYSRKVSHDEG